MASGGDTRPDTKSVTAGHDASQHGGSLKPPVYETSTFVFETAEEGKRFFEVAYGLDEAAPDENLGFSYSRIDTPNARVAESRIAVWEGAEDALVFNSGMAAISTVFFTFLRPGDQILYSSPAYGGTAKILEGLLGEYGVEAVAFDAKTTRSDLETMATDRLAMVYLESPANPTCDIFDIRMAADLARERAALSAVDNTLLSPVWQRPLELGADLSIQSATKYLGGHSDLTAGVVSGSLAALEELRHNRYRLGATAQPHTAWLLARSLETLRMRVERQTSNATILAAFLARHPRIASVSHLSLLADDDPRKALHESQSDGTGAMMAFEVFGGEEAAFRFLNSMKLVNLAVSLGGTESLASHPWTMSHSTMAPKEKEAIGVTEGLVRFSVGVEDPDDLINDLSQALDAI